MQTLDQEKFDSVKELAGIQMSVAEGRSALLALKKDTEEYMKLREVEAEERVARVLKESQEALQKISTNHQELTAYGRELQAYAIELTGFSRTLHTLFQDFADRMKQADEDMASHREQVATVLREAKVVHVAIAEDRKQMARERQETNEGMRVLNDGRATLERAWAELKRLKDKQ